MASVFTELKKSFRRNIRFHPLVERGQQLVRLNSKLSLAPIDLEIDVRPDDILIDCGANVGDITSAFARTGATVYAFEPNPLCFSVLRSRFAMTPNVKLTNAGVMDRECTLTLSSPKAHEKWDQLDATVAASFTTTAADHDTVEVPCISLSDFVKSLSKSVRLLKLDIEGAEIEVLNSLLDTEAIERVGLTVVETHEDQIPSLAEKTKALRQRIAASPFADRVRLDWL